MISTAPISSFNEDLDSKSFSDAKSPLESPILQADAAPLAAPLAVVSNNRPESVLGNAVLRFFRIRKAAPKIDLDAVGYTPGRH